MGRYFKTIPVELNKDFIYEPPVDMMANVLKTVDSKRDAVEEYKDKLASQLKLEGMEGVDSQRASEIIKNYNTKIDDISKRLSEGNMNFGQIMGEVKNTGREVYQDFTMGEASKIAGNKALFDKQVAADIEKTKAKQGYATSQDVDDIINYNKSRFEGTNYKDAGNYNKLDYEDAAAYFDDMELSKDVGTGFLQDGESYNVDSTGNGYITTRSGERKGVDPKRVREYAQEVVTNNTLRNQYLGQKERVGSLSKKDREKIDKDLVNSIVTKYSGYVKSSGKELKSDATQLARDASNKEKGISSNAYMTLATTPRTAAQLHEINIDRDNYVLSIAKRYEIPASGKNSKGQNIYNYDKVIAFMKNSKSNTPEVLKFKTKIIHKLETANKEYKRKFTEVGYGRLSEIIGDTDGKKTVAFKKEINDRFNSKNSAGSKSINSIIMDEFTIDGKRPMVNNKPVKVSLIELFNNPVKYGFETNQFKVSGMTDAEVINNAYNNNSAAPAVLSATDMSLNDFIFDFNLPGHTVQAKANFNNIGVNINN